MPAIRQILVAVKDPSSRSQTAVAKAAQLAEALGARLELFHALTEPLHTDLYVYGDRSMNAVKRDLHARSRGQLEHIANQYGRGTAGTRVAVEWDYPAYEAVIRRAGRIKADCIIAGLHSGRRVAPWLLRLNDWELLRLSPIPVLLVKTPGIYDHPVVLAAVDPSHRFEKPAGLDKVILQTAIAITTALRGTLHAAHAYTPVLDGAVSPNALDPGTAGRINIELAAAATARFDRVLKLTKIPRSRRHLSSRPPVEAIETTARAIHSSLVVMGALSRSGLRRLFIGNTAESLLDQLPCDVLIVKPAHFTHRVPRARRGVRITLSTPITPLA